MKTKNIFTTIGYSFFDNPLFFKSKVKKFLTIGYYDSNSDSILLIWN